MAIKMKKKKSKKKPIRKAPRKATNKPSRLSFLTRRKDINDKFFDIVKLKTKVKPTQEDVFKRYGGKQLADEMEISVSTLRRWIKKGSINEKDKIAVALIEGYHKQTKIKKTKKVTREYTVHNFTRENFFKKTNFKNQKGYQFYFRAGLWLQFKSGKKGKYTIQNLPISHYSSSYKRGYKEFFEIIKIKLDSHPSLLKFRFNYFDVEKIKM